MEYFHTSCPACHTRFRISDTQLNARNGQVRCGACGQIFNAKAELKKIQTASPTIITPTKTEVNFNASKPAERSATNPITANRGKRTRDSQSIEQHYQPQNLPRASSKVPLTVEEPQPSKSEIAHQKKTEYHYSKYNDSELPEVDQEFLKRLEQLDNPDNFTLSDSTKVNKTILDKDKASDNKIDKKLDNPSALKKSEENLTETQSTANNKLDYNNLSNPSVIHASNVTMNPIDTSNHHLAGLAGFNSHLKLLDEKNRKWLYLLIGLLSLLLIQLFIFYRTEISSSMPKLKGVYETLCAPFGCDVPLPRELAKLTVEGSDMEQAIGSKSNLITLHVTIKNHANYVVEYPAIALDVLDEGQKTIARKILYPSDYLNSMKTLKRGLAPEETQLNIRLELERLEAYGYHLELLYSSAVTY